MPLRQRRVHCPYLYERRCWLAQVRRGGAALCRLCCAREWLSGRGTGLDPRRSWRLRIRWSCCRSLRSENGRDPCQSPSMAASVEGGEGGTVLTKSGALATEHRTLRAAISSRIWPAAKAADLSKSTVMRCPLWNRAASSMSPLSLYSQSRRPLMSRSGYWLPPRLHLTFFRSV